jgi:hypothetical protein
VCGKMVNTKIVHLCVLCVILRFERVLHNYM